MRRDYSRVHRLSGCRYDASAVADDIFPPIRLGDLYGDTQEKSEGTNKSGPTSLTHGTPRCACVSAREIARSAQGGLETRAHSEINGIGRLPSSTLALIGIERRRPPAPRLRLKVGERVRHAWLLGLDVEAERAQDAPAVEDDRLPRNRRFDSVRDDLAGLALRTRFHASDLVQVTAGGQRCDAHRNLHPSPVNIARLRLHLPEARERAALPISLKFGDRDERAMEPPPFPFDFAPEGAEVLPAFINRARTLTTPTSISRYTTATSKPASACCGCPTAPGTGPRRACPVNRRGIFTPRIASSGDVTDGRGCGRGGVTIARSAVHSPGQ